ncbi:hypothetical protein KBK19_05970 [Microvirga sp. STR05]|uniref:DUF5777 domain-containing protein n=1 Tax=Hymenobacter duratus TaxID=2771356 RepID=A0ABR8JCP2_9BACT|nr:DUF5777 family beta-barrel protein [Hymenobacter duratus]MBD2714574.1 hypothetical protein [Hymenobacter duratus]MBR7949478.1 hypothetical protein [Microvirga sp. STR05]
MLHFYSYRFRVAVMSIMGLLCAATAAAQDVPPPAAPDLLNDLERQTTDTLRRETVQATFKGTRIINGHSVETPGAGTLIFLISHRFGTLNSGAYNFFGLDQATIRLGLEYGLNDRLTVGVGRSSLEKTYDGFLKYRALRQTSGARPMPVSVTLFASSAINTLRYIDGVDYTLPRRLTYTYQAMIARKFSPNLSVQLSPTVVHRNLVDTRQMHNDVVALGVAGRQKLSKRTALMLEYYYRLPTSEDPGTRNAIAAGFDIETGGHVFQLHVTNSQGMIEKHFMTQTYGNFFDGDIYFGFNVARNFTLKPRL